MSQGSNPSQHQKRRPDWAALAIAGPGIRIVLGVLVRLLLTVGQRGMQQRRTGG